MRPSRFVRLAASSILALSASARPALPPGGSVVLETPDGSRSELALEGLELGDPTESGAALIRFRGVDPAPLPGDEADRALVRLVPRGRVVGPVLGGEGETLHLALVGDVRLALGIDEVRSLEFPGRRPAEFTDSLEAPAEGDRLYRLVGGSVDILAGAVLQFGVPGVTFEDTRVGEKLVPWEEVLALFVEVLDEAPAAPPGVPVVVDLIDGGRLPAVWKALAGEELRLGTRGGRALRLPVGGILEVLVDDGRIVFLSDLEPKRAAEGSPFGDELGMVWRHRVDAAVSGGPLRAGGARHARGIGVHAPSSLVFALDRAWSTLRGAVAVDDSVLPLPARGSVRCHVFVDGVERWSSPVLRGGDPPLALPAIDLAGAEELELRVDDAGDGFAGDRADWLGLYLIRG